MTMTIITVFIVAKPPIIATMTHKNVLMVANSYYFKIRTFGNINYLFLFDFPFLKGAAYATNKQD
jgi:hypothetical protein